MTAKKDKIGVYPFVAEQYMCNFRKQIFTSALIQQILATADYHSTEREFGTEQIEECGKTWVLSRFAIEINKLPSRHDKYDIQTYINSARSSFSNRNFIAQYKDGTPLAYAKSVWAVLDIESREPHNVLEIGEGIMSDYVVDEESANIPIEKPDRVNFEENPVLFRTIDTYYNDVDFNGHINSCRYIDHALNLFSFDWHKKYSVGRLDIVFSSEAHCGDKLKFYCSAPYYPNSSDANSELSPAEQNIDCVEHKVKICKVVKGTETETECVRLKIRWKRL